MFVVSMSAHFLQRSHINRRIAEQIPTLQHSPNEYRATRMILVFTFTHPHGCPPPVSPAFYRHSP